MKEKKNSESKQKNWQKKAKEYLAGWQRAKADLKNYKKEVAKNRQKRSRRDRSQIVADVLPILDGLELLAREMKRALHLEEVPTDEFNPEIHEAVDGQGEKIAQVAQKGYQSKGQLVRPAKVRLEE